MNHDDVLLVGVGDPDGKEESFCYTVDAPTNLWIGALTEQGSRMAIGFMAGLLNQLIEGDCWLEGMSYVEVDQGGVLLTATVGELVPARSVSAFLCQTNMVRRVSVTVGRAVDEAGAEEEAGAATRGPGGADDSPDGA